MFEKYLTLWHLTPDGKPIITNTSQLLPVRFADKFENKATMLKIAVSDEEKLGNELMVWWNGHGAAQVFAHDDNAVLLERAEGAKSLIEMTHRGKDEEATRIICRVTKQLHEYESAQAAPNLVPLTRWFRSLLQKSGDTDYIFAASVKTAQKLLANPQLPEVILHGDIHHANILDFEQRGWQAIDPKGLRGERGFDYANIFCNPDFETANDPEIFRKRVAIVADEANLERTRLLEWILAWAGLSATWLIEDGLNFEIPLAVAKLAATGLSL